MKALFGFLVVLALLASLVVGFCSHPVITGVGVVVAIVLLATFVKRVVVNEATATAFQFLGGYTYCIMRYENRQFDATGYVLKGSGRQSIGTPWFILPVGGWVFYVRGLVKPTQYLNMNQDDGFGKGVSVFLNDIQRNIDVKKAETGKEENIALDISAFCKMWVVNPYRFLFVAPKDVIAKVVEVIVGIIKAWVATQSISDVQALRTNGVGGLASSIGGTNKKARDEIADRWGIFVDLEGLGVTSVDFQREDQDALAAKKRQQLEASGAAQELMGAMLENTAVALGLENGDLAREQLKKTDEGRQALDQMLAGANKLVIQRKLSQAGGFIKVEGDPLTGLVGKLLGGGIGSSSSGSKPSGEDSGGRGQSRGRRKVQDMSSEEVDQAWEEETKE